MIKNLPTSRKTFICFNYIFLTLISLTCILPMIHILAVSLSVSWAVEGGAVKLWPVGFTLKPYSFILTEQKFFSAFLISLKREALGVFINMFLTVTAAYPLSRSKKQFRFREVYVTFFLITILFHGGLIPLYVTVYNTGLIDSIWSLVLPSAVPVFNIILLQNFFKALPNEIEEASVIDGAGPWRILWKIFIPLSKPALATLALFSGVSHWNSWLDGLIYMNMPRNYPLQSYLQTVIVQRNLQIATSANFSELMNVCERNSKAAQIFIAMLPILLVYPFLQKYFTKGIILGSVKG